MSHLAIDLPPSLRAAQRPTLPDLRLPVELLGWHSLGEIWAGDNAAALEWMRHSDVTEYSEGRLQWGEHLIDWHGRVPGLRTWAGQMTLAKIIKSRRAELSDTSDLLTSRVGIAGVTGLDHDSAADPIDIGFSPPKHGMLISQRAGLELLAVLGAQILPVVSIDARRVGVLIAGRLMAWTVEPRADGYRFRWGPLEAEI